jgi:hypothetical protein
MICAPGATGCYGVAGYTSVAAELMAVPPPAPLVPRVACTADQLLWALQQWGA